MKHLITIRVAAITLLFLVSYNVRSQETVFALLKNDERLADNYFDQHNYRSALAMYKKSTRKNLPATVEIKIARCHYSLKEYDLAAEHFGHVLSAGGKLPSQDIFSYAESLSSAKKYTMAIEVYRQYLTLNPDDELVTKKVWRLNNLRYALEDSAQYLLRSLSFNSEAGELYAAPLDEGVVFLSNRKGIPVVEKTDAALAAPFYQAWYVGIKNDSLHPGLPLYTRPSGFASELNLKFHAGPISFFDKNHRLVYTSTGAADQMGRRMLELCFAELRNGKWVATGKFPHNGAAYSNTDPFMTEDGKALYFSSDRSGGQGGKDLYRSKLINGKWSAPENLGEIVNTRGDEITPFISQNHALYFSSNGHPGIGGLDVFKAEIENDVFQEPQLIGYPLNTSADEFAAFVDSTGNHGYLSSNRKNKAFDDDVYEFDMDLQTYPLVISGQLRFKEHNWNDSSTLQPFVNARIELIDNIKNVTVFESSSDTKGDFSITIPRFSNYRIRVVGTDQEDHVVSLEIPRQRKLYTNHEIVIVKDAFRLKNDSTK